MLRPPKEVQKTENYLNKRKGVLTRAQIRSGGNGSTAAARGGANWGRGRRRRIWGTAFTKEIMKNSRALQSFSSISRNPGIRIGGLRVSHRHRAHRIFKSPFPLWSSITEQLQESKWSASGLRKESKLVFFVFVFCITRKAEAKGARFPEKMIV